MAESDPIQKSERPALRVLLSVFLFLTGLASTFGVFYVLTIYNLLGFRGSPRQSNPFAHQNVRVADLIVLGIIASVAAVLTMYRKEQNLAPSFLYGMWLGLVVSLAMILLR
jgi:hypothetical protein